MQFDKSFTSHFVDPDTKLPITGLTGVTITILQRNDDNTYIKVIDTQACTEISDGWYQFVFTAIQDKFYLYAIYPNDDRVQPESGFVDKRLNNLDGAITDIRTHGGGMTMNVSSIQATISNARESLIREMGKNQTQTLKEFKNTNGIIEQANSELAVLSNKVSDIIIDDSKVIGKIEELRPVISDIAKDAKEIAKATPKIAESLEKADKEVEQDRRIIETLTRIEMEQKQENDKQTEEYLGNLLDKQQKEIELFLKSEEEDKKKEEEEKKKEMKEKLKEIEMEQKELESEKAEILKELK